MITVFIEYKTVESKRDEHRRLLAEMPARLERLGAKEYRSWEGWDQPGLFVEAFHVATIDQYETIKAWRLADREFCACIAGGAEKLHVWAFQPVELA
ncbi:hypothetical protein KDJ56_18280 [Brevibacillus composti]|uniref:Uncharacterized protein n=1 Tax=Brevibacillus composti TaxID=2796470 RepID=A0A7T5JN82_9BACL|nr:hypothetical protein [Brevibacillus composti]QQE73802.1 hypothetical protein JD108_18340 [Brevibacillus composti]QUO40886.1 hypothetical protein KDJ56_18280 [Brevibacillus composti]